MNEALIIGGGPSGLAAGYEITRHGGRVTVLEKLESVGGLSRTIARDGCLYDIGPHRFFTKNEEVHQLFVDIVAEDLLRVPRLTRIFFKNRFFNYPLTPANALFGLGVADTMRIMASYGAQRVRRTIRQREPANFEEWVTDQFGSRLFEIFFKTYTEKVWGIPCTQIGAEWAGQRIKGLNLRQAITNALFKSGSRSIKTLVDEFIFPRLGAGQLYEKMAAIMRARGASVRTGFQLTRFLREGARVRGAVARDREGREEVFEADHFICSAPLTETVEAMEPPPPPEVLRACRRLRYRDHIGVQIKLKVNPFPDNWIYVHSKELKMARIANYRNFSPFMAQGEAISPLTIEYFAFPGDELSRRSDAALVELATAELGTMNLIGMSDILSAAVVRSANAYPLSERGSHEQVQVLKGWLDTMENIIPIGRCGLFKYNNQDHAIATGLLAARTVLGLGRYDPWQVNIDAEYHESARAR